MKIEIKSIFGAVLFEYDCESNTMFKALLKAISERANLSYANLSGADLSYANLSGADLRDANLSGADLSGADLSYANLRDADLSYADLSGADLSGTDLSYADLSGADLSGTNLSGANLSYANLSYADLSYADLSGADLSGANLSGARTDKKYIQVSCIGSAKRMTTYCFDDEIIWCGCFKGNLEQFERQVIETHKDNEQYLKEYLGFINYVKSIK